MPTLKDVAKAAGVSVSTVSHVLNGYSDVNAGTRERVWTAIGSLGYHANSAARALVSRRSGLMGILLFGEGISHPFFHQVLQGAIAGIEESGREALVTVIPYDSPKEPSIFRTMHERKLEGLLVMGVSEDQPVSLRIKDSGIPTVFVDADITGYNTGNVRSDNRKGAHMAADYLLKLGHRRIAYINDISEARIFTERYEGFLEALKGFDLGHEPTLLFRARNTTPDGIRQAKSVADSGCTAVMAFSDRVALGLMDGLKGMGIAVPESISIIGYDDMELAAASVPSLTTVRQHGILMGRTAAKELDDLAMERLEKGRGILIGTQLVVRDSTALPRRIPAGNGIRSRA